MYTCERPLRVFDINLFSVNNNFINQWFFIIGATGLFILSDALAANWAKNDSPVSIALLLALAPLGYIFFGYLNKIRSLSVSSGLVNMFLLIGTILVGVFIFNDSITVKQIIGLCFAFVAVFLLI
ncbi:MAG: hypothetical protein KBD00_00660 [Candidatus Peribacteraceae bacterium]|nr:hypothetical protein [Candidatus Peribacteraceae bacterium]